MKNSALAISVLLAATAIVTPPATDATTSDTQIASESDTSTIVYESAIIGDIADKASQVVTLANGVTALIQVDVSEDTIEITADNDEHYVFSLSEVQTHAHNESAPATPQVKSLKTKNLKRPNSCQVATGIAGVGHSALWSAAAGSVAGPAGIAAGAAAGAFWAALGTQC